MKYIATIKNYYDSESKMFDTMGAAERWLDSNNNNLEKTTLIDVYDDNWRKVDGVIYTEGNKVSI